MRQVLFFCLLSFTLALGKSEWSEPADVTKVVDPILPVRRTEEQVVPETLASDPTLAIGGATGLRPNYVMTTVEQPRGKRIAGGAEMSMGMNRVIYHVA